MNRLEFAPAAGRWYVSEGMMASRTGPDERLVRHNSGPRIVGGPYETELEATEVLPAFAGTYEPYVWQCHGPD